MKRMVIIFLLILGVCYFMDSQGGSRDMTETTEEAFAAMRQQMVQRQIESRGVKDPLVLDAMRSVRRHRYVPDNMRRYAYYDEPLPIGYEQTISQPYIVAYMTESLGLKGNEKVLEIGTGSGYQAAVLAEVVKEVYTIEIVEPLAERAEESLREEGYSNVHCRAGDGYQGWPEAAPFDAVIITAAPPRIPEPLIEQLKVGGRMIVPVGTLYQELVLLTKKKKGVEKQRLLPVRFVPMTGEIQTKN